MGPREPTLHPSSSLTAAPGLYGEAEREKFTAEINQL